jgi:3',5'-cyclic AMP phosphodiesterase CpdA
VRTIVHLSDLHFGRVDPRIPPALLAAVTAAQPDLVVVSGDFTQRARVQEFKEAARFVASLPQPRLLVPGNHDVPLYDLMRRWLAPLRRYRRYITQDLAPFYADTEIAVLGVNTARALTFKNGRINQAQLAAVTERLATFGPGVTRIVVTHHPFDAPDPVLAGARPPHGVVGRAQMAMAGFLQSRVDMILSGHLHVSHIGRTAQRYPLPGRSALLIQAGTATSTRKRGEVNAFNIVRIARPEAAVACMVWDGAPGGFRQAGVDRFTESEAGWSRLDAR